MIKFFRKVRQKLLEQNRVSKYLLYAFGEIVLVVIGILIALQINNWNENQKKIKQSNIALKELQTEILATKEIIKQRNKGNFQIINRMKTYLEGKILNPSDSVKNLIVTTSIAYNPVKLSIPIIEREISANKQIINEKNLLKELQEFDNLHISANQQLTYLDNYWNSNLTNFLEKNKLMLAFVSLAGNLDVEKQSLAILYDSDDFKNIIAMEYLHVDDYTKRIDKLQKQLEKVENQLSQVISAKLK